MKQRKLAADERSAYVARGGLGCPFRDCTGESADVLADGQEEEHEFIYRCYRCMRYFTEIRDATDEKVVDVVAEE